MTQTAVLRVVGSHHATVKHQSLPGRFNTRPGVRLFHERLQTSDIDMKWLNILFCLLLVLRSALGDREAEPYQWLYFWSVFELDNKVNGARRSVVPHWNPPSGFTFDDFVEYVNDGVSFGGTFQRGVITDPDDIGKSVKDWKRHNFYVKYNTIQITGGIDTMNSGDLFRWFTNVGQELRKTGDFEETFVKRWRTLLEPVHARRIAVMSGKFISNLKKEKQPWAKHVVWYDKTSFDMTYKDINYYSTVENFPADEPHAADDFEDFYSTYRQKSKNRSHIEVVDALAQTRSHVEGPKPC